MRYGNLTMGHLRNEPFTNFAVEKIFSKEKRILGNNTATNHRRRGRCAQCARAGRQILLLPAKVNIAR